MGVGGILFKETGGAGVCLSMGGIFSREDRNGDGTDAVLGWVLAEVVALWVGGGQTSGAFTLEGSVLVKFFGLDEGVGLLTVVDVEARVGVDIVTVVEGKTGAGLEGGAVTAMGGGTATGALDSPAAEL